MALSDQGTSWVKRSSPGDALERIEGYFEGNDGCHPHRHDTYAVVRTLAGVQALHYRGQRWFSTPGSVMIIHPDELHEDNAGDEHGVRYRIAYIAPALIQQVLGGQALPFVPQAVAATPLLQHMADTLLRPPEEPMHVSQAQDALFDLAQTLAHSAGAPVSTRTPDFTAAERARSYIHDCLLQDIDLDDLANASGVTRWRLCRDFRVLYGTSPSRYVTLRRLEHARNAMLAGRSIAEAALASGFADQSHLTRQFSQSYGVSPARWLRKLRSG